MALKEPNPDTQTGLTRLPEDVRNKMGYAKKGGLMKKAKRFNGEDGSTVEDDSEIIFDNRTVKEGKLPSESMYRETTVSAPVPKPKPRPKATPLSEPRNTRGQTFTEAIAKSRVPAPKEDVKKPEMAKPEPSPGALGFKGLRSFLSGLGKPYGSEKFEKEQRSKKSMAAEGSYKKGGSVSSASKRADGCAIRGKTRA